MEPVIVSSVPVAVSFGFAFAAFVAGVVVEDKVLIVPRVRDFIADVKARIARFRG